MLENNELAKLRELLTAPEPPELGPGPRRGVLSLGELNHSLDRHFSGSKLAARQGDLVRAALLLWHDHHEPAHELSQRIKTPDGSLLHGILHRREPDYGNARHWFRRTGEHPAYSLITRRLADRPELDAARAGKLLPQGRWDAFAFVDACEQAARLVETDPWKILLRAIQQAEFDCVLEHLCSAAAR